VRGSTSLISTYLSTTGSTGFGTSVASAGDVNGDGFGDVVVGAPNATGGSVLVYHSTGASFSAISTTIPTPAGVVRFGSFVAGIGDVNRDGFSDIAVATGSNRLFVFHGSATGVSTTPAASINAPVGASGVFGSAIATACDLNADGFGDLVVGINGPANAVYVYDGSSTGIAASPTLTIAGPVAGSGFGTTVQCAGDGNGDGFVDLAVGSPGNSRVYVFHGSATGVSATASATLGAVVAVSQLGALLSYGGDIDGDGYGDVLAGSGTSGIVRVFWGGASGVSETAALSLPSFGVNGVTSITATDVYTEAGAVRFDVIAARTATSLYGYRWSGSRASMTLFASASVTTGTGAVVSAQ
jgi:hypothetical protein